MTMKALTVQQPWASLIIHGHDHNGGRRYKDIENRTWGTAYRGVVAIHAGKKRDTRGFDELWHLLDLNPAAYPLGVVLGTVEIVDCVTNHDSLWFDGPYGFVLRNPTAFSTPIPALGKLGFWDWIQEGKA